MIEYVEKAAKSNFQRGFSALAGISKIAQDPYMAASRIFRSRKTTDTCGQNGFGIVDSLLLSGLKQNDTIQVDCVWSVFFSELPRLVLVPRSLGVVHHAKIG